VYTGDDGSEIARQRGKSPGHSHATGGRDGAEETQTSGQGFLFIYFFFTCSLNWFLFSLFGCREKEQGMQWKIKIWVCVYFTNAASD